jgi:hypothetical protein
MTPARQRLLRTGVTAGVAAGLGTHLMCLLKDGCPQYLTCLSIFGSWLLAALPGAAFRNPRQVDWYRRALLLPGTVPWGLGLVGAAFDFPAALAGTFLVATLAILAAPLVWLVGALWIRGHPILTPAC